jgi:anti-sigma B factor antagonist
MKFLYREAAPDSYLVNLSGPLNVTRSEDVVRLFGDLSERGIQRLVIDMEHVPFIDSQGLAALIAGYEIFGSDVGTFQLTAVQDQPRLVLELTGFDRVFETNGHLLNGAAEAIALELHGQFLPGPNSFAYVSQFAPLDLVA